MDNIDNIDKDDEMNNVDKMEDYDLGYDYSDWKVGSQGSNWDGDCRKLKTKDDDIIDRNSDMIRCSISKYIYPCKRLPCKLEEIGNTGQDKKRQLIYKKTLREYCEKSPIACAKTGYEGESKPIDPICFEINECSEGTKLSDIPDQAMLAFDFFKSLLDFGLKDEIQKRVKKSRISDVNKSKANRMEIEMEIIKDAVIEYFKTLNSKDTSMEESPDNLSISSNNSSISSNNSPISSNNSSISSNSPPELSLQQDIPPEPPKEAQDLRGIVLGNNNSSPGSIGGGKKKSNKKKKYRNKISKKNKQNKLKGGSNNTNTKKSNSGRKQLKYTKGALRGISNLVPTGPINIDRTKKRLGLRDPVNNCEKDKVQNWDDALSIYEVIESSEKGKKMSGTAIISSKKIANKTAANLDENIRQKKKCLENIKITIDVSNQPAIKMNTGFKSVLQGHEIFKRWKTLKRLKELYKGRGAMSAIRNMTWGNYNALKQQQSAVPSLFKKSKSDK